MLEAFSNQPVLPPLPPIPLEKSAPTDQMVQENAIIYQVLKALADIAGTFNQYLHDHTEQLLLQLDQYMKATKDVVGCMRLQSGLTFGITFLQGAAGIGSAFFPKIADATTQPPAAQGIFQAIAAKFKDNQFMRTTLTTAAKALPSINSGAETLFRSWTTQDEAKRTLITQVRFDEAKGGQNTAQETSRKVLDIGTQLIEKRSRGA